MWSGNPDINNNVPHYKEIKMKAKFNLTGAVENLAGAFGMEKGKANLDCNIELEYSVEEMVELIKLQKEVIPGLLNFVKEMQELSGKKYYDEEKERELRNLRFENEQLKRVDKEAK